MRRALIFAVFALVPLQACGGAVPFADANELIAVIESKVRMPPGSHPIATYTRTYSRLSPDGRGFEEGYVYGVLERISDEPRVARWSEERAAVPADGGCAVVTLRYNLATASIDRIACNGEA